MKVWVQTAEEGHLGDEGTGYKCTCVGEVLPEGESWTGQRESVWTGKGGDFSAMATPFGDVPGGSNASRAIQSRYKAYYFESG